jgi:hypothetical protein
MRGRFNDPSESRDPGRQVLERPRYRRISSRIFGDERFLRLSKPQPNAQTLWFFLLTGPCTRAIPGLFPAGERALAEMLGWSLRSFRGAFDELEALGMVKADWPHRLIWVPKAVRHNPPESPNVVRSWRSILDETTECTLRTEAIAALAEYCQNLSEGFAKAFTEAFGEAFPEGHPRSSAHPFPKASPNQDQEAGSGSRSSAPPKASGNSRRTHGRSAGVFAGQLPRDHVEHVACDERLVWCVHRKVHARFVAKLAPKFGGDHDAASAALLAWYPIVWATLAPTDVIGDAFEFWQPRFNEHFASAAAVHSAARPRDCDHQPTCPSEREHSDRLLTELRSAGRRAVV